MRTTVHSVRTFVLIFVFVIFSKISFSQSITTGNGKIEIGLGLGPLFFLGDLGGNKGIGTNNLKDVNFPLTNMAKGIYANIYPAEWLGFRVAINQGKLEGYDSIIQGKGGAEEHRIRRNLQFQSNIFEAYAALEFYPTVFFEKYDGLKGKFRPYGVIGAGAFKFNPKGKYYAPNGTASWVDLKPLRTEGQGMAQYPDRKEYSLTSFEIPLGGGFKYYISEKMFVGLEVMHRKSFSDYVDDVSTSYIDNIYFGQYLSTEQAAMANQLYCREFYVPYGTSSRAVVGHERGDPKDNDSFFSTIIRFGWRLNDSNSPNGRALRQMRCPAYY